MPDEIQPDEIQRYHGKRIHFIGIGGISMHGLAKLLHEAGYVVTGSDRASSHLTDELCQRGIKVWIGHRAEQVDGAELVIYTAAITPENPEWKRARQIGLPMLDRATLLGQLMRPYPHRIGISGMHGKTSATSMIATIFELTGQQPTIHIGGELPLIGGCVKAGGHEIFITEADEYVGTFLKLFPSIAVLLNIDVDHLDYFRDLDHIVSVFRQYIAQLPPDGVCIGNYDDPRVRSLMDDAVCRRITYGMNADADWYARAIRLDDQGRARFQAVYQGRYLTDITLGVPGRHHVYNALASLATGYLFELNAEDMARALSSYQSTKRRFEYKGDYNGATVYSDYAHHPTEIAALIDTARAVCQGQTHLVFQPHTYTRTKTLFDAFADTLAQPGLHVIITDIYAASEPDPGDIHARDLVAAIRNRGGICYYSTGDLDTLTQLRQSVAPGDSIFIVGAGTIDHFCETLTNHHYN